MNSGSLESMENQGWMIQMLIFCTLFLTAYVDGNGKEASIINSTPEFWESRFATHSPILKMLKRQVRNFRPGHVATITVVYQATRPVQVRWFRFDSRKILANSEVINHLPVDGDSTDYEVSFIKSGEVTAATLSIKRYQEGSVQEFETILTTTDGTIQYQLHTEVLSRLDGTRLDDINSPEWLYTPPTHIEFDSQGRLDVHCAVFVPKENSSYSNELTLFRGNRSTDQLVINIHTDTSNVAEESGTALLIGRRHRTRIGHVIYQIGMSTENASREYTGKYQCYFERRWDKLYVLSTVSMFGSTLYKDPILELISCEKDNFETRTATLTLQEGNATCVRCRAYGYPKPTVSIFFGNTNTELGGYGDGVGVTKYTNVADGGIEEATYTFHRPRASVLPEGRYTCRAQNKQTTKVLRFQIKYRHRYY